MNTLWGPSKETPGIPEWSKTWIVSTGARCFIWISLAKVAVTFSSLRFSSPVGMVKRKTRTCPELVPAHIVGDVVVGSLINVSAKCMHRTMDPKPSSDPDLASMARSTGRASGLSARGLEGGRERGSLAQLIDMESNRETSVLQLSNEFLSIRDKTSLRVGLEDEDETK